MSLGLSVFLTFLVMLITIPGGLLLVAWLIKQLNSRQLNKDNTFHGNSRH